MTARFVVIKFQPWGDSVLLTSKAWMLLEELATAHPPVEVWYFDTFALAAEAVALWPDDGCTGVVPLTAISVLDRPDAAATPA
jgi:hypothetical protein